MRKQLKELKNIDKNETLKAIDEINKIHDEANKLLPEFIKLDETLDTVELVCTITVATNYEFNRFFSCIKIY